MLKGLEGFENKRNLDLEVAPYFDVGCVVQKEALGVSATENSPVALVHGMERMQI